MPPRFYKPQWLSHSAFMKIPKSTPHERPRQVPVSQDVATHLSLPLVRYLDTSPQSLDRHSGIHSPPALCSNTENFQSDILAQTTHSAYPIGRLISLGSMYKSSWQTFCYYVHLTFLGLCGQYWIPGGLDQCRDLSFSDTHSQDPSSLASLFPSHTWSLMSSEGQKKHFPDFSQVLGFWDSIEHLCSIPSLNYFCQCYKRFSCHSPLPFSLRHSHTYIQTWHWAEIPGDWVCFEYSSRTQPYFFASLSAAAPATFQSFCLFFFQKIMSLHSLKWLQSLESGLPLLLKWSFKSPHMMSNSNWPAVFLAHHKSVPTDWSSYCHVESCAYDHLLS